MHSFKRAGCVPAMKIENTVVLKFITIILCYYIMFTEWTTKNQIEFQMTILPRECEQFDCALRNVRFGLIASKFETRKNKWKER